MHLFPLLQKTYVTDVSSESQTCTQKVILVGKGREILSITVSRYLNVRNCGSDVDTEYYYDLQQLCDLEILFFKYKLLS